MVTRAVYPPLRSLPPGSNNAKPPPTPAAGWQHRTLFSCCSFTYWTVTVSRLLSDSTLRVARGWPKTYNGPEASNSTPHKNIDRRPKNKFGGHSSSHDSVLTSRRQTTSAHWLWPVAFLYTFIRFAFIHSCFGCVDRGRDRLLILHCQSQESQVRHPEV